MDRIPHVRSPRDHLITALCGSSVALAVGYLLWRSIATVGGADPLAAGLLLAAEMLSALGFAARVRSARTAPLVVLPAPDAPHPDTSAVVDATRASVGELRTTLLSLRRVRGLAGVVVVAPDASFTVRSVVERLGATLAAEDATVESVVRGAPSSWVLVLRAGDLPMPDLVTVCAARCSAPDVAVVQVAVEEADPTSFEHDPDGWWSPVPFEQQVVRPSLAARGSLPWYGDGPTLVRRAALGTVPPAPEGRLLDDTRRVGLDLLRAGFAVTLVPVTLARVQGPFGLDDSLRRRRQRLHAAVRHLGRRELRGIPRPAVVAHVLSALPTLVAVQRVALAAVALLVLVGGRTPIAADPLLVVAVASVVYGLRAVAVLVLGRGRLAPRTLWRSELRSLGVDLLAVLPPRDRTGRAGVRVLAGLVVTLAVAVAWASVAWWQGTTGRAPADVTIVTMVAVAVFLLVATEVLIDALARRQRRHQHRVRLGLVTCRIEDHEGQLVDLSAGGAGVVIMAPADAGPPEGEVTTVAFRIPDADGAWRNVTTLARVAHRRPDPDGGVRLGLAFDEPTDAPLDPVVEFLTIDRRLVALGRHEHAPG